MFRFVIHLVALAAPFVTVTSALSWLWLWLWLRLWLCIPVGGKRQ